MYSLVKFNRIAVICKYKLLPSLFLRWLATALQTQDSKLKPWRSEAEHASSRSRRLSMILSFTSGWGRNMFVFLKPQRPGNETWTLAWKAPVLTTTLGTQEVLLAQFSLYVHKGGLKPDSFHFHYGDNHDRYFRFVFIHFVVTTTLPIPLLGYVCVP